MKIYLNNVYDNDRDATARAERQEEVRQSANELEAQEPDLSPDDSAPETEAMQALLDLFKQQDSGANHPLL
jgi:hypothetical protein